MPNACLKQRSVLPLVPDEVEINYAGCSTHCFTDGVRAS